MEDGLEVSKAGERPTRRTVQTVVYDKADSEHHFCGRGHNLSEITGKTLVQVFFFPVDERDYF